MGSSTTDRRMTVAEAAKKIGMNQMALADALRMDSQREYPKYPFASPVKLPSGRWNYNISRTRFDAWNNGDMGMTEEALADRIAERVFQRIKNGGYLFLG